MFEAQVGENTNRFPRSYIAIDDIVVKTRSCTDLRGICFLHQDNLTIQYREFVSSAKIENFILIIFLLKTLIVGKRWQGYCSEYPQYMFWNKNKIKICV